MIYLLFPTARPNMFKATHSEWMRKCSNPNNIITKVVVSSESHKGELADYDVMVVESENTGVCYPSYCLTKSLEANDDDIIILASDDFYPCENWDNYLYEKFAGFNGCLFVNDGYQDPKSREGWLSITIPIMTYYCLRQLNMAIYHPSYIHFFGDTELYINVRDLCLLKDERDIDSVVFEHKHHVTGKRQSDEVDDRLIKAWEHDQPNYESRLNLHVSNRIKI